MLLQDAKILVDIERLNGLLHAFEDIMFSSSNDTGYTKLIDMDIETDPNLPPIASKPYSPPLNINGGLDNI